eukprot:GSMAST32.ASY1.ANO1.451.1 assembled CDS
MSDTSDKFSFSANAGVFTPSPDALAAAAAFAVPKPEEVSVVPPVPPTTDTSSVEVPKEPKEPQEVAEVKVVTEDEPEPEPEALPETKKTRNLDTYLAAKSFDELDIPEDIRRGMRERKTAGGLEFDKPSLIQAKVLPLALSGKNLMAQAKNGAGKTAAFMLTMYAQIDRENTATQCICVCPTRELAIQTHEVGEKMGNFSEPKITSYLAVPSDQRHKIPKHITGQIVVGTIGRVNELLKKKVIRCASVKIFVVDEADVISSDPKLKNIRKMIVKGNKSAPLQTMLFSATFAQDKIDFFRSMLGAEHAEIDVGEIADDMEKLKIAGIQEFHIDMPGSTEDAMFKWCEEAMGVFDVATTIIFCRTRSTVHALTKYLRDKGDMEKVERDTVVREFREGVSKVLIATNVIARGLDVQKVHLVVNMDIPLAGWETKPRILRGRFGKAGVALTLTRTPDDVKYLREIETALKRKLTPLPFTTDMDVLEEYIATAQKATEEMSLL